jgi:hypothetical protein
MVASGRASVAGYHRDRITSQIHILPDQPGVPFPCFIKSQPSVSLRPGHGHAPRHFGQSQEDPRRRLKDIGQLNLGPVDRAANGGSLLKPALEPASAVFRCRPVTAPAEVGPDVWCHAPDRRASGPPGRDCHRHSLHASSLNPAEARPAGPLPQLTQASGLPPVLRITRHGWLTGIETAHSPRADGVTFYLDEDSVDNEPTVRMVP